MNKQKALVSNTTILRYLKSSIQICFSRISVVYQQMLVEEMFVTSPQREVRSLHQNVNQMH